MAWIEFALAMALFLASHRIPALWAMHSLHHSDPEMTALTTNRHFWGDQLIKALTIWSAMSWNVFSIRSSWPRATPR